MKLEVKGIKKSFNNTEVLHGIDFEIESGKALGLLGRNGAGKTTTIRILMDVFKANEGTITLDGKPFKARDFKIGYLPEERGLNPKLKVCDQLIYMAELRGLTRKQAKENTKKWLEKIGVMEYYNRKLDTLSKGNQQKIQIVQSLVCEPEIVILDEPFSGLDPVNSQILKDAVKEIIKEEKIVIFSSHQMGYVEEFCEEICIINQGDVVLSGNLDKIKKDFGQDRLVLSATNYGVNEIENIITSQLNSKCDVVKVNFDCVVLELKDKADKNSLLKDILKTDIDIDTFGLYKPSLTEIFVEKAGD